MVGSFTPVKLARDISIQMTSLPTSALTTPGTQCDCSVSVSFDCAASLC